MKKNKLINILMIMILSSIIVNAMGVTLPYTPKDGYGQLEAARGFTEDIVFELQNGESESIKVKAIIEEGNEIARIEGENEYSLPTKSKGTVIPLKIKVPRKSLEEKYFVRIHLLKVNESPSGTSLTSGIELRFWVNVIDLSLVQQLNRILPFKVQDAAGFLLLIVVLVVLTVYLKKKSLKNRY
jgi:hypothetical protein